ncbi:MAG: MBL fold hydrolase [Waddliaceae bacterium]|nr:MBL fold hydrolase [Waddliaceae bacterium]
MIIKSFPCGPFATNAIILICEDTLESFIIDPSPQSTDKIVSFLEEKSAKPTKILLTHSHWDHIGDVSTVQKHFNIPVWVHKLDAENLHKPGSDHLPLMFPIEGVEANHFFEEGDEIILGNSSFVVIHTPGHSPGSVCFYCKEQKILISGDTLFQGSIGNLSFPTSEPQKMWVSLDKLKDLPPETRVYPGHGSPTSIGNESWLPRAREIFESY